MGCGSSTESIQTTQTRGKGRSNNRPGRKSVRKMKKRIRHDLHNFSAMSNLKWEVDLKRITREEFDQLLLVCQVGNFVDLPSGEYLSRIKQDVQLVLADDNGGGGEGLFHYNRQLSRWLRKYPNIQIPNKLSNYKTDPNKVIFPLAVDDPSIFRKWVLKWERFDTNVPKSGAWLTQELHIVKNDLATADQIQTLSLRQTRTNLGDRKWMAKRRREIANIFLKNHDSLDSNVVSSFLTFANNLDKAWKEFQELCDKPFDPPERYKKLYNLMA